MSKDLNTSKDYKKAWKKMHSNFSPPDIDDVLRQNMFLKLLGTYGPYEMAPCNRSEFVVSERKKYILIIKSKFENYRT